MFQSLRSLSDHELIICTERLTRQERELTLSVLAHLNEIERRKLFLKRGYPSMFVYCTRGLGYSGSAAIRRIRTARCSRRFPEVLELLQRNEVNLSTVSQVYRILNSDNVTVILARIRGKSQREVEAIAAEYEPLGSVPRERVRTVVVRVAVQAAEELHNGNGCPGEETPEVAACSSTSEHESCRHTDEYNRNGCGADLPLAGAAVLQRRSIIQFSAGESLMRKLERVRALTSHRLSDASFEALVELMADYVIEREDPAARQERRERRTQKAAVNGPARVKKSSRNVAASIRDQVFVRDKQRCTYVSPDGRRCDSTHVLQIDHIKPVARGGASSIENLRLLCAHHNRLEAERLGLMPHRLGSCVAGVENGSQRNDGPTRGS